MAKVSKKKQLLALENILLRLERGHAFLMHENTLVCIHRRVASTALDYIRPNDGAVCAEIAKETGSDLALLHRGINNLREFIAENSEK